VAAGGADAYCPTHAQASMKFEKNTYPKNRAKTPAWFSGGPFLRNEANSAVDPSRDTDGPSGEYPADTSRLALTLHH
jgi:hypothetical protein